MSPIIPTIPTTIIPIITQVAPESKAPGHLPQTKTIEEKFLTILVPQLIGKYSLLLLLHKTSQLGSTTVKVPYKLCPLCLVLMKREFMGRLSPSDHF